MRTLLKFLLAILLLTVASVSWGACPEGTKNNYKGECIKVLGGLAELKTTGNCVSCDLSGVNLEGANLTGANLFGADLTGANLGGATLFDANLGEANLFLAKLRGADLRKTNFSGANLQIAVLSFANLTGANLSTANLGGAFMHRVNLTAANLTGANLEWAALTEANLSGTIFCNTIMRDKQINNSGCQQVTATTPTTTKPESQPEPTPDPEDAQPKQEETKPTQTAETSLELEFWQSIKDSNDQAMYQAYLDKYPDGEFAPLAKINLSKLTGATETIASAIPDLNYGRYHALVIGNNDYDYLKDLKTAINDAEGVASLLEEDYGFEVSLLKNATRAETVTALASFRRTVSSQDSLLIYYAGHGHLDEAADEGYWLPVDSSPDDPGNWLQNHTVVAQIRAMDAKHVMIVADSCFSGTLTRAIKIELRTPSDLQKIVEKKARTALTSGGLEPVLDSRGGAHSVFAKSFISLLEENPGVLDAHQLFSSLRTQVALNSSQIPEYGNIHEAGHDGGDFLFVKTAKISTEPATASSVETPTVEEQIAPDNSAEVAFWQSIEDSDDPDMYQAYLEEFPEGKFVSLAKIKLKNLEPTIETVVEESKATEETVVEVKTEEEKETASEPEKKVTLKKKEGDTCPDGQTQTYKGCEDSAEVATEREDRAAEAKARALAIAEAAGAASGTETSTSTTSGTSTNTGTEVGVGTAACRAAKQAERAADKARYAAFDAWLDEPSGTKKADRLKAIKNALEKEYWDLVRAEGRACCGDSPKGYKC